MREIIVKVPVEVGEELRALKGCKRAIVKGVG